MDKDKNIEVSPAYEEQIYEAIRKKRASLAQSCAISGINTDSLMLKETYADLLQKAEVLFGRRSKALTLEAAAGICGEYMRYIGRYDGQTNFCESTASAPEDAYCFTREDKSTAVVFGKEKRANSSQKKIKHGMAVILLDSNGDTSLLHSLFANEHIKNIYTHTEKINIYGIIGTLSALCDGVRADISRLSTELTPAELLVKEMPKAYLCFCHKENCRLLCDTASMCGISAIHFAYTDKSGVLKTRECEIPIRQLSTLMGSENDIVASISEPDFLRAVKKSKVIATHNGKAIGIPYGCLSEACGRIISPACICPEENACGEAMDVLTDSILSLVSCGIDRRAICSALSYEFPSDGTSSEDIGEDLGLILGAYRVGIELAFSEGMTKLIYKKRRALLSVLYAQKPRISIEGTFVNDGSYLAFLSLGRGSDGMVDFSELRRVCDSFTELCKKGRVLSATAVIGSLSDAVGSMGGKLHAELFEGTEYAADAKCKGLLFETDCHEGLNIIGKVKKASTIDAYSTDC